MAIQLVLPKHGPNQLAHLYQEEKEKKEKETRGAPRSWQGKIDGRDTGESSAG